MTSFLHDCDNSTHKSRYYFSKPLSGCFFLIHIIYAQQRGERRELIMNSDTVGIQTQRPITEKTRKLTGKVVRLAFILLLSSAAFAQYGGGGMGGTGTTGTTTSTGTYTPSTKSYGNGKAIGIGVGAAAAGVVAVYLMTHRASKVSGCVETADDGLHLTDDKTKRTLALVPGASDVRAGERVELKGKIKKNAAGDQSFLVKSVAKDLGQCHS
jgi:hypothetical protein